MITLLPGQGEESGNYRKPLTERDSMLWKLLGRVPTLSGMPSRA
jgi:hypothetical protein